MRDSLSDRERGGHCHPDAAGNPPLAGDGILKPSPPARRVFHALSFLLILFLGGLLRFWNIEGKSLWHDEGHSLAFVRLPWADMERALAFDDHPPLYYWTLRAWLLLGDDTGWGRRLSAILSWATLPAAYCLGRMLGGPLSGLLAMLLLALSPEAAHYGQELRMYALQSFLLAWMMPAGLRALRGEGPGWTVAALLLGSLACYTHYFSGIFVVGFIVTIGVAQAAHCQNPVRGVAWAAACALFCEILYLPWLRTGMSHLMVNSFRGLKAAPASESRGMEFIQRCTEMIVGFVPALPFDSSWMSIDQLLVARQWVALIAPLTVAALIVIGLIALRGGGERVSPMAGSKALVSRMKGTDREEASPPDPSPQVERGGQSPLKSGGEASPPVPSPRMEEGAGAGKGLPGPGFAGGNAVRLFLTGFLVIPWALAILYEQAGGRFYPRFLLPLLPLGFTLAAVGLTRMRLTLTPWLIGLAVCGVFWASCVASLGVDLRDVSRDVAEELKMGRAALRGTPAENAPVLHAGTHSFWTLMGYDPVPGRHRYLAGPEPPALARLMYGPQFWVTGGELRSFSCVWVVYSEWGFGPPRLRREVEPEWFGEGWSVAAEPPPARRYNKKMEVVLYVRK